MDDISWVKLSVGLFDNKKIKHIRTLPDGDRIALFWVMLITLAGHCNCGGKVFFLEDIPYTPKTLAKEANMEENVVKLALDSFKLLKMIDIDEDGFVYILNWAEYQSDEKLSEIREKNRLRQQAFRERQKALAGHNVTCDVTRNAQEREERKQDINILSFSPRVCASNNIEIPAEVVISDEELRLLAEELTKEEFEHYITAVSDTERSGKHYTKMSHYQAIIKMAQADRKKAQAVRRYKGPKKTESAPSFDIEKIEKMMFAADPAL
jgi:predicted phage replisome organizer